jgi:hypothetical protein
MATGILLRNCVDVRLDNISMTGMDNAFEIYDSDDIKMNDIDLRATRTAVKGERVRRLTASSVTHSEDGWLPRVTPLAIAVRRISHGHV